MSNPNAGPGGPGGTGGPIPGSPFGPGQRPSPEQIQMMQRQIAAEAEKAGMSVPEFVEHVKKQQIARMQQQRAAGGAGAGTGPAGPAAKGPGGPAPRPGAPGARPGGVGQQQPITPGPPNPKALAVANFLKSQELKPRTCILNGERKDMFKGVSKPSTPLPLSIR